MTTHVYMCRGAGLIQRFDPPLPYAIWCQLVTGGIYEVDLIGEIQIDSRDFFWAPGQQTNPKPATGRPLTRMPAQSADVTAWRQWVVDTYGMTAAEA